MPNRVSLMAAVPIALVLGLGLFGLTLRAGLPGLEVVSLSYHDDKEGCSADDLDEPKDKILKKSDHDFLLLRISNKCKAEVTVKVSTTSPVDCLGEPSNVGVGTFPIPSGEKAYLLCRSNSGSDEVPVQVKQRRRRDTPVRLNEIGVDPPPGMIMKQDYVVPSSTPSLVPTSPSPAPARGIE